MQDYGRLSNLRLLQLLIRSAEHDVRYTIAKNLIGLFEQLFCLGRVVIEVFAHSYELSTLTGEYVCCLKALLLEKVLRTVNDALFEYIICFYDRQNILGINLSRAYTP